MHQVRFDRRFFGYGETAAVDFEWDDQKRRENLRKHGVDFLDAALIFGETHFSRIDDRKDYGEARWVTLGMVEGVAYVVVHTGRNGSTRIISAWKGGANERENYRTLLSRRVGGPEGAR